MDAYADPRIGLKGKETREDFLRLYKKCKDSKQARRYHAMYLSFSYSWREIAGILGIDYETVLEWVHLYNRHGLEGLVVGRPPGRPASLTSGQEGRIRDAVKQCPRDIGMGFSNWTVARLAKWIAGRFGVLLSCERVRQLLHCMGFSYVKPKYSYILADRKERKAFLAEFREIASSGETYLFEDESTVSQHPTLHGMWVLKGTKARVRTFGNHAKRHAFAAANPVTGKVVSMVAKKLNAATFIRFLEKLLAAFTAPFTLILDNSPCHKAKAVQEYLEKRKHRIRVVWLPRYSPDLNPKEHVWKDMKLDVSHNRMFGTANKLAWGIRVYFRRLKPEKVISLCSPDYLFGKL